MTSLRNTLNEEIPRNKLEGGDKEEIRDAVQETSDWLEEISWHTGDPEIDSLVEGIGYSCSLSRSRFEELCMDYFRKFHGQVPIGWHPTCATRRAAG